MGNQIVVRTARPDEYAEVGAVTARAYEEFVPKEHGEWATYLGRIADIARRAARTTVLVALDGDKVAGSATVELDARVSEESERPLAPDEAHLRMLGVHPAYRRRGIARQLVEACIEVARSKGKRRLTLDTGPQMRAAQAMYAAMGFRKSGVRELDNGFCLYSYELPLDQPAALDTR
jgi:ribosomal protein S18 acetylase RimI-like enzyme